MNMKGKFLSPKKGLLLCRYDPFMTRLEQGGRKEAHMLKGP